MIQRQEDQERFFEIMLALNTIDRSPARFDSIEFTALLVEAMKSGPLKFYMFINDYFDELYKKPVRYASADGTQREFGKELEIYINAKANFWKQRLLK
jgi:hypothetical protein